ncbi:hypothetical protein [Solibacillus sp. NPDC093137]|uniref:hypothetical protein n=1 Tax=Solibacillus sp. NPDC093137 TaxID=3390678 RepID=UPI003CFBC96A
MPYKKSKIKRIYEDCDSYPSFRASCCSPGLPGPPGPPGPPGTGVTPTFGSLYGDFTQRPVVAGTRIEFDTAGPVSNTIADPLTNSITILTNGIYEISAGLESLHLNGNASVRYQISRNGSQIDGSVFSASGTGIHSSGKTVQTSLVTGDVITVDAFAASSNSPQYSDASLTVNLIGP